MTNPPGTRMVFNIKYAGQLIKMGHKILETMPNPRKPELDMFLFQADPTFDEDLRKLQRGGSE
jgi:hypothetical protein